jgi:ribosomal protein S18 acetylase RimI-like enzyme
MIEIRDATPDDAEQLAPLLQALGYPTEPATLRLRLRDLIAEDPTGRVLIAVRGPEVVGFATLHGTPVLHRPTPVGRITGLAVGPGARGSGAGRLLVETAESHFRALGWARLEVTSGPTHQAAYDFYRHLGYQDHGVRFAKPLSAPA